MVICEKHHLSARFYREISKRQIVQTYWLLYNSPSLKDECMINEQTLIKDLTTLNQIAETLNRAVDMQTALYSALIQLLELISMETGWIFLKDPTAQSRWGGRGYILATYHNLPPAMEAGSAKAWRGGCDCQTLCNKGNLTNAYNEVHCSRLAGSRGNRKGLIVHASTPLVSGERILGILNIASPTWNHFTPASLALLTNVGSLMGIALERARLYDMLKEQHIHEQAVLIKFSNQLLGRHTFDELMTCMIDEICRVLVIDACALVLPNEDPTLLDYKAAQGWKHDPVAYHRQVPNDKTSTSGLAMQTQRSVVVNDLKTQDPTPWSSHWFTREGFRGHVAAPLLVDERSIGVLIINTRTPRQFDDNALRFIRLMANQAALALEKARLHQEEVKRQRMEEELAVGQQIQLSLLPEGSPTIPGWEFAAMYCPARLVGGDFYDFFELPGKPRRFGIVIADVAGKGVPAALFMALSRSMIRTKALTGCSPVTAFKRANRLIARDSRSNLFLSAFYALLDVESGTLTYARAGHDLPLWLKTQNSQPVTIESLQAKGIVLGIFEHIELEERQIQLEHGDMLILYTDGITEAFNEHEEMFGTERLQDLVQHHAHLNAQAMIQLITDHVKNFMQTREQADDFTMVVIKRVK